MRSKISETSAPLPQDRAALAEPKTIVIVGRCGRLANRITLFANFVAWAAEHHYRLINFTFHSYAHLFETTRRDIYCQYPPPSRRSWIDRLPGLAPTIRATRIFAHLAKTLGSVNERWPVFGRTTTLRECYKPGELISELDGAEVERRIKNARLVLVDGWTFRAPEPVLLRHREKLQAYFRPIAKHALACRQLTDGLRQGAEILVGVHVRRGDYASWRNGRYFFPVSRYAEWMAELAGQFPNQKVSFLVCSNEARSLEEFPGLSVHWSTGVPIEDLYALGECDYILGPVSSFTQWASFYGNKPLLHLTSREMRVDRAAFAVACLGQVPH